MSYDLAVWSHVPRTVKDAPAIYAKLCEGDTSLLKPHADSASAIQAFLAELTARFPEIDSFSDDDVDDCVWMSAFDVSNAHVILTIAFSRAEAVMPWVEMLAEKQGLVCYNPQIEAIRLPRKPKPAGV